MIDDIFPSLKDNDKYLLAIYTLFSTQGADTRQVKAVMGTLTGKPFVDLKVALGRLESKGLLRISGYNWRTDTSDYLVREEYLIPAMTYFYGKEKELTLRVLEAAKAMKPTSVQRILWRYISSDYSDIAWEEIDDYAISTGLLSFIPAVCDPGFAPLLMLFNKDNFFGLLNVFFIKVFVDQEVIDISYVRSFISSYKANNIEDLRRSFLCLCDLYSYFAYGEMPQNLLADNKNHRVIAALAEAYKGNVKAAAEHYRKALALHNKRNGHFSKKQLYFPLSIVNFFYVLISYLTPDDDGYKRALGVAKSRDEAVTASGKVLFNVLFEKATGNKLERLLDELLNDMDSVERALAGLMCRYVGKVPLREEPLQWLILRHEMRKYIPMDAEAQAKADAVYGKKTLLSSIYHKQEWENVLEELTGKNVVSAESGEKKSRIAYVLNSIDSPCVSVKVQTVLKSGAWSAGKAASMTDFYDCALREMTQRDIDIANAARFGREEYSFINVKYVLPEMVGDSRLYVGSYAPYTLVEVTEEIPYINLTRTTSGFVVSSNVPLDKVEDGIAIVHREAASISFVRITEQQQAYYRRLLALGHFPLEAEEQLREFLKGIGGKIEVNSDLIEGGSTMPIVDGQSRLVTQMRPNGRSEYAVSIFVRPLEGGRKKCKPGSGDDVVIDCVEGNQYTRVQRNKRLEKENLKHFADAVGVNAKAVGGTVIVDAYDLLPLVEYAQHNPDRIACEWQEGTQIKVGARSTTSWGGVIKKNENGWFEIEGTVELEPGKVVTMAQLLDLVSQSKGRYIKLSDGEFIALSDKLRRQLAQLNAIASRSHGKLQMSPFSAALLGADILCGELTLEEDEELKEIRKRIKTASQYTPEVPETLNATLRNYQREGYVWMSRLNKWGAGALLADDMGLGKTIQTIAFLLSKAAEGPALVVAPASVAPNWKTEFDKFAPSLSVTILNFSVHRQSVVETAAAGDVVIVTYGLLLSVKDFLVKKHWNTICLDEAHIIKNRGAKTSAVAMRLKSDNRIMLTGTPIQNHLGELWNLFQFVNPGLLGAFEDFSRRFIVPIEQNGDKGQQKELDRLIKPFMLRRTKDKVAKELPEKEEIYQHVTLSEEEMLIYEVLRRRAEAMLIAEGDGKVSMNTLAEITRLRQCACDVRLVEEGRKGSGGKTSSKITALVELLQTIIEGLTVNASGRMQGGVLVFSQFTSYLALVKQALDAVAIPYLYIDGSIDLKTRQKLVQEFQDGSCPVFLISLKAGGLGLNLTRANYVIHTDPWWNPAIEAQATDRVHRIGQKQSVTVYHLIAEGTIEEKIQRLHERKLALAQDVLESTDMSHKLTGEDLLKMVRQG